MSDAGANAAIDILGALGLNRVPFPPTPDAEAYFHTDALESDLAEAAHCVLARKGFVLMTGEVGMGKSTFLRRLLDVVERRGAVASMVFNTFLQGPQLLGAILRDFGIESSGDAAADIDRLNAFLVRRWQADTTCVLVIDDAQNLGLESLELLRLLSNLETGQEKLLQIVLAGQPELGEVLDRREIRQLTSRIVKHVRMAALGEGECTRYVNFRLSQAGAGDRIHLTAAAHAAVYRHSRGNPRRIHLIMDRCLYGVIACDAPTIDAALVRVAATEAGFNNTVIRRVGPVRVAVAAVLASVAFAAIAGVALNREPETPRAKDGGIAAAVTPVAISTVAAAPEITDNDPTIAWRACIERLSASSGNTRASLQLLTVPASRIPMLSQRNDVCVAQRHRRWVAAWYPQWLPARLLDDEPSGLVRDLQAVLAAQRPVSDHGLRDNALPVDGLFGPRTRAALARFQQRNGLDATGRPDPLSLLLLSHALSAPRPSATPSTLEIQNGRG